MGGESLVMTHNSPQTASEGSGIWLPLVEYSLKSGVSLSTIRRKIKTNSIPFRLEKGKYLILFSGHWQIQPRGEYHETLQRPQTVAESPRVFQSADFRPPPSPTQISSVVPSVPPRPNIDLAQLPLLERAVKMVSDAYETTLKEKDERIHLLEEKQREMGERIAELQLLVKVLEEKYSIEY